LWRAIEAPGSLRWIGPFAILHRGPKEV